MTVAQAVQAPQSYAGAFEFDAQVEKQIVGYTDALWDISTSPKGHVTYKLIKAGDPIYAEVRPVAPVAEYKDAYVPGYYGTEYDNSSYYERQANEWGDYTIWK
jgi:hypothetical protein